MAKKKLPTDRNKKAKAILDVITDETPLTDDGKNAAAALGRLRGLPSTLFTSISQKFKRRSVLLLPHSGID